ncbi:uncharacterized protein PV07_06474 [Cladophialophora immunda]|uniref:Uncharacterized protein n=1 Tax=Cladophialophora immunda TaxID=569365 RepID=A0A0D2ANH9_9EURO|nr:uncharacterized protein PV07_06474 [Cladophialophora immunda]KIW26657.1 hypothetical protein PV07_06474 [Cladophialophora immunda]
MADPLDPAFSIYQGVWTDWSRGKTWGLTLTLCPTHATILTNSLAVFVTICGIQLWNIVRQLIYKFCTPAKPEMLTPHLRKQRAVLKNAGSDIITTAGRMLRLAWGHRRTSTGKPSLRSYSIGVFAIIYAILFWTAGIFSNRAISTGSTNGPWPALSRSKHCGIWNQTYFEIVNNNNVSTEENFGLVVQYVAKAGKDVQQSLEYAQECYGTNSPVTSVSSTCNTFKTSSLNWTVSPGTCPFPAQTCLKDSPVKVLDTEEIDSHEDLGINADPKDRLKYWRRTTCAVLDGTDRIKGWNGTIVGSPDSRPTPDTAHAYYGPSLYKDTEWTYAYSNFASFFDNFTAQVTLPYQLDVELAYALSDSKPSPSDFQPIEELVLKDADLNLLFLSYTGMYLEKVDDPWFSAHNEASFDSQYPYLQTRYYRDLAISTLACTEQHNFCTYDNNCTDFLGFDQVQRVASFNALLTPHQNATFDRMMRAVTESSLRNIIQSLALTTTPMLASNKTAVGASGAVLSSALPPDQWTSELVYYHSVAMAHLQRTIFQWATGSVAAVPQHFEYLLPPTEEQDIWYCNNMIVQSNAYQSFTLLIIILIIIFGTLVISAAAISKCFAKPPKDDLLDDRSPLRPRTPPLCNRKVGGSRRSDPLGAFELVNLELVPNNHRVSSPTLPAEDREISILSSSSNCENGGTRLAVPRRPTRDSWIAISLNDFESSPPEPRIQMGDCNSRRPMPRPFIVPPPTAHFSARPSERPKNGIIDSWI